MSTGMRALISDLAKAGIIPAIAGRTPSTTNVSSLPALIMGRVGFGVGLEVEETSHPKWAGRRILIKHVKPNLGGITGTIFAQINPPFGSASDDRQVQLPDVDVYGGKWRILKTTNL